MVAPAFHLQEQHRTSHRYAILEDDGTTLWLYLSAPDDPAVVAETQVFSHDSPIATEEWPLFQAARPMFAPAADGPVDAIGDRPEAHVWHFRWSDDGEAVAAFCDARPIAMVQSSRKIGFSRNVIRAGPWGVPWSERTFHELFGMTPEE